MVPAWEAMGVLEGQEGLEGLVVWEDLVEAPLMLKAASPIILVDRLAFQVVKVVLVSKDHEVWMDRGV